MSTELTIKMFHFELDSTVKGVQQGNWQGARYAPYGYNYNKVAKLLEIAPALSLIHI